MNRSQTAVLLGLAAARDRRTVGETDVLAWAEDLADIDFDDAREALGRHYRTSTNWLMPAHIRELVRIIRRDRRDRGSEALAIGTYGWGNPRPGQVDLNRRGRAQCDAATRQADAA